MMTHKQYVARRTSLIPMAEKIAHERVSEHIAIFGNDPVFVDGKADPVTGKSEKFRWSFFTQFFHEEMERLAKAEGLT